MKIRFSFLIIFCLFSIELLGQKQNDDVYLFVGVSRQNYRQNLRFPDIGNYYTIKCDFHTHTPISDGQVWPVGRVNEAWNDGLDLIAITDHIEVRKNKEIIQCDFNKSYQLALERAKQIGMMVIPGAEITRKKPLGHINALFIQDANKLEVDDEMEAINEAYRQGAFLLWNHPGYPDGKSDMYPVHKRLIAEGKLRGVEVFNKTEAYPRVYDYVVEYDLVPFADSDIHYMSGSIYPERASRPMTLVFAKARTVEAVKDALFEGRAVAYFGGYLMGKEEYIRPLLEKSLQFKAIRDIKGTRRVYEVINNSDICFLIQPASAQCPLPIYGGQTLRLDINKGEEVFFPNCVLAKDRFLSMLFW